MTNMIANHVYLGVRRDVWLNLVSAKKVSLMNDLPNGGHPEALNTQAQ